MAIFKVGIIYLQQDPLKLPDVGLLISTWGRYNFNY